MDNSVPRPHRNYTFIASIVGGVLVCIDYVSLLVVIATLPPGDTAGLGALPYVLIGLALGLAMVASAYLGRSSSERRWPYILLGSSLLSLFLYVSLISLMGGVLGCAASTYLLAKRRTEPRVKSA